MDDFTAPFREIVKEFKELLDSFEKDYQDKSYTKRDSELLTIAFSDLESAGAKLDQAGRDFQRYTSTTIEPLRARVLALP